MRESEPAEGGVIRFSVRDTGPGIDQKTQGRLFARFTQVDSSVSRKYGGSGLGLSICRRLVEIMGGQIGVQSAPGQGSTFWFTLTLERGAAPVVAEEPAASLSSAAARRPILVVDDVDTNLRLVALMLKSAGHLVETAGSGRAAIEAVCRADFELIFMDIQMPEMDGYEATAHIRNLPAPKNATPIVALTANAMPEEIQRCLDAGMNGHVAKPIERKPLLDAVARFADNAVNATAPVPR